jgi:hypothetical protein
MKIHNPLEFLPQDARKPLLWGLLIATLFLLIVFQRINAPLVNSTAPAGIVSLQVAATPQRTLAILESWDIGTFLFAAFGLGFDYLFMILYALTVSLATLMAAGRAAGWLAGLGPWAAWGVILAALLDALENFGQAQEVLNGVIASWPAFIAVCAYLKFTLLSAGIIYSLVAWLLSRKR